MVVLPCSFVSPFFSKIRPFCQTSERRREKRKNCDLGRQPTCIQKKQDRTLSLIFFIKTYRARISRIYIHTYTHAFTIHHAFKMSFAISQTSLTARSSSAFTSSVRVNRTRMASRHSSSSSKVSLVTKCEGPTAKNLEIMRKFSEQYARSSGTKFCMDKSVTAVVIQGTFLSITQTSSLSFGLFSDCFFPSVCACISDRPRGREEKFSSQGGIHSMMMTIEITIARSHLYHPTDFLFSSLSRRF